MKGVVSILVLCLWGVANSNTANAQPQPQQQQNPAKEKITKLAGDYLETVCEACKVNITVKWMPGDIAALDSTAIQFITLPARLPRGYQNATVHYQNPDQGTMQHAQIQLYIQIIQHLPVASQRMFAGRQIGENQIHYQWIDITKMRTLPVAKLEDIRHKVTANIVEEGHAFFKKDFENRPVIEAGDTVDMIYQEAGFKIRIACLARESKAEGELIRLYNKETRTTYLAKVINKTKIRWEKTL